MTFWDADLRQHMPVAEHTAYFDHAAVAPLPRAAAKAISNYAQQAAESGNHHWLQWAAAVGRLRQTAAEFLNAGEDEVALISNTTQGINWIAEGFPWRSGDNVVLPDNEFPSNLLPWRNLARRGVELRLVPTPPDGHVSLQALGSAMDSRTRILAISWVGFVSGFRNDVSQLAELAHERGCLLMLDAIQGLGAFPLNVAESGVDFVCADGHKWMLGPEGAGLMYVRREHLNLLEPLGVGWGSLASGSFDPTSVEIKKTAARYEGGSMNMAGMLGFGESLALLHALGASQHDSPVAAAILANVAELGERLRGAGFTVHLPPQENRRSGILGITWAMSSSAEAEHVYQQARKFCIQRNISLSVRGGRMRISAHAYNNSLDHQHLVDTLVAFRAA